MLITHIKLKNWRNFRDLDVPLRSTSYILGPNASGKSNFLDVFRFLRDISKPKGGGLQAAMADRGGISKVRCLHARRDPEILIDVSLAESPDDLAIWRYVLAFKSEARGANRILITREQVWSGSKCILDRPQGDDKADIMLLTQTHLEQIQANTHFRDLVTFFGGITYLHLVPQLLKHTDRIGGQRLADDPFGQSFLERLAKTPQKTRISRLNKIGEALKAAVPQFKELKFEKDETGHPHLHALYTHHRPNAGWQSEEQFSDGTLRLLGLLWALLENNSLLLLEEPEISLNDAIVRQIPIIIHKLQKDRKIRRQVILSTHSEALLDNPGIDGKGVILLESGADGTKARTIIPAEARALEAGLSVAEVVLPKARPADIEQLRLW